MEVPVVATRVGGVPEAVSDGVTGILVEPHDEKALVAAIVRMIEDPTGRAEMGRKGREYVLSKYRWQDCTSKMEALYHRLMRQKVSTQLGETC
jgi:glycosyltransferase involved in cell wall biosynthesis